MPGIGQNLLDWLRPATLVKAPVTGKLIPLAAVRDQAFSQKLMGDGIALIPQDGKVVAPVDGEVSKIFPLGNAIGLETKNGISVLIHIGVGTEDVDGSLFHPCVSKGDQVKTGDLLLEFDFKAARKQLPSLVTPVIITNMSGRRRVIPVTADHAVAGRDVILRIIGR